MAISEPISNPPVTEVRRTSRASIEVPRTGPYEFLVYREKQFLDAEGNIVLIETSQAAVRRRFDAIGTETVTVTGGLVLTGDQVIEALATLFDRWADEDAARATAPVAFVPAPSPIAPPAPPPAF